MPDLNSGTPWSKLDDSDLRYHLAAGISREETARFLCRDVAEVETRIQELGIEGPAPMR